MNLGKAIKELRKKRNLDQKKLASMCEISVNALSLIETNGSFPQKSTIEKICTALEIPVSYLLFYSITEDDVPDNKKDVFRVLNQSLKSILMENPKS